ncbi:hypothetical protein DYU11_00015 [Fibrisoma montanum]|uniref:DUF2079 domain-containing protein n=1 Tax=Fibrisoma montanum TaxID=2305895 RepID=A0A418MH42_9BACT|nr:hypothetical protein [Fibrisoma montanum]RIV26747.1 hypothetical protein DYU11_00015 [Fibrisoma montanum]
MQRSTYWIGLFLLAFFAFKVLRFQTLAYTYNDMYAFLQMSCSWMDGRPFMYENIWGYHHKIHNYYTVLLWGPLCRFFGVYGLFAVQTALLLISYGLVNERLARRSVPPWARYALLGTMLLGPVSFWLNDHPNIGWHTELTYLPAALLFALALSGASRPAAIAAGLGVVLIKEDGAILGALIHLAYDGVRFMRDQPKRPLWQWLTQPRFWLIGLGWGCVFVLGMVWLGFKNNFAEPRLQQALNLIGSGSGELAFWRQMLILVGQSVLLLLPVLGLLLWFGKALGRGIGSKALVMWLAGVAVLTGLNFVQSSLYYGQPLFSMVSLTWPPRFVLLWAFSAAFLTTLLYELGGGFQSVVKWPVGLVGGGLFVLQLPLLYLARPDFPTPREWAATVRGRYYAEKNPAYLQPGDLAIIRCLADQLPPRSNVFAFDFLVPFFHRHYGIWPTGNQYCPADVALLPIDDPQGLRKVLPMREPYEVIRLKAYNLYVSAPYKRAVKQCIR